MSQETQEWLNGGNILVGMNQNAWWRDDELIADLGIESPFYEGAIPVEDVRRRLFDFKVESYPNATLRPVAENEVSTFEKDSLIVIDGQSYRVVVDHGRKSVGPADTDDVFGVFSQGYDTESHQFADVLLTNVSNLLDDDIGVESAGLLKNRALAWVSVSVPESITTPEGVEFRARLIAASSFDGTLATQYARVISLAVCDNTLAMCLAENDDQKVKIRHTKNSGLRIASAREALAIVHTMNDEFSEEVSKLVAETVTEKQWQSVLDALAPIPEDEGRGKTVAETKRDRLVSLYKHDPRVAPWTGTSFGVVQAFNTYDQHYAQLKNVAHRAERNQLHVINGKVAEKDAKVLDTLELVLAK